MTSTLISVAIGILSVISTVGSIVWFVLDERAYRRDRGGWQRQLRGDPDWIATDGYGTVEYRLEAARSAYLRDDGDVIDFILAVDAADRHADNLDPYAAR